MTTLPTQRLLRDRLPAGTHLRDLWVVALFSELTYTSLVALVHEALLVSLHQADVPQIHRKFIVGC
jgi:hypothetical protein